MQDPEELFLYGILCGKEIWKLTELLVKTILQVLNPETHNNVEAKND